MTVFGYTPPANWGDSMNSRFVTEIVAAYVGKNALPPAELPALISTVSQALGGLGKKTVVAAAPLTPAVPIRRSVLADEIICLDCGYKAKMLKRHLSSAHNLTPEDYRARWGLQTEYPMTAAAYSARRSELAKASGLGRGGRSSRK
jgi:predicted transcriptional regulator